MQVYRILADIVCCFHAFWAILILSGIFVAMRWRWYMPYHCIALISTAVSQVLFLGCPLTALENSLRASYDPKAVHTGSFTCYCLERYFGYKIQPEIVTLVLLIIITLSVLVVYFRRPLKQS